MDTRWYQSQAAPLSSPATWPHPAHVAVTPCSMSSYRAEYAKRERAADAALPRCVAAQPSQQAIRSDQRVPRSLLPTLEHWWAQHESQQPQQQQQAGDFGS